MNVDKVIRIEVIDEKGRSYVNWNSNNIVELQLQDDERTLKIFIKQGRVLKVDKEVALEKQ